MVFDDLSQVLSLKSLGHNHRLHKNEAITTFEELHIK